MAGNILLIIKALYIQNKYKVNHTIRYSFHTKILYNCRPCRGAPSVPTHNVIPSSAVLLEFSLVRMSYLSKSINYTPISFLWKTGFAISSEITRIQDCHLSATNSADNVPSCPKFRPRPAKNVHSRPRAILLLQFNFRKTYFSQFFIFAKWPHMKFGVIQLFYLSFLLCEVLQLQPNLLSKS